MPTKIILDTNFLFIPARYKVDVFSEMEKICDFGYEICIIDKSIEEINKIINKSKGRTKQEAELAFKLISSKNPKVLKTGADFQGKGVDDTIVNLADRDYIVATQDKELKERLLKKGVSVIVLRQKKHLKIIKA